VRGSAPASATSPLLERPLCSQELAEAIVDFEAGLDRLRTGTFALAGARLAVFLELDFLRAGPADREPGSSVIVRVRPLLCAVLVSFFGVKVPMRERDIC
jgi:hypothetical protein